jgi:hypothetical protein
VYFSPLYRAFDPLDKIVRRIGMQIQSAYASKLQMDLIPGDEWESGMKGAKAARRNRKKTAAKREREQRQKQRKKAQLKQERTRCVMLRACVLSLVGYRVRSQSCCVCIVCECV